MSDLISRDELITLLDKFIEMIQESKDIYGSIYISRDGVSISIYPVIDEWKDFNKVQEDMLCGYVERKQE